MEQGARQPLGALTSPLSRAPACSRLSPPPPRDSPAEERPPPRGRSAPRTTGRSGDRSRARLSPHRAALFPLGTSRCQSLAARRHRILHPPFPASPLRRTHPPTPRPAMAAGPRRLPEPSPRFSAMRSQPRIGRRPHLGAGVAPSQLSPAFRPREAVAPNRPRHWCRALPLPQPRPEQPLSAAPAARGAGGDGQEVQGLGRAWCSCSWARA